MPSVAQRDRAACDVPAWRRPCTDGHRHSHKIKAAPTGPFLLTTTTTTTLHQVAYLPLPLFPHLPSLTCCSSLLCLFMSSLGPVTRAMFNQTRSNARRMPRANSTNEDQATVKGILAANDCCCVFMDLQWYVRIRCIYAANTCHRIKYAASSAIRHFPPRRWRQRDISRPSA